MARKHQKIESWGALEFAIRELKSEPKFLEFLVALDAVREEHVRVLAEPTIQSHEDYIRLGAVIHLCDYIGSIFDEATKTVNPDS